VRDLILGGALVLAFFAPGWVGHVSPQSAALVPPRVVADFDGEPVSAEVRYTANWAIAEGDNKTQDFLIIDKTAARLYVLNGVGRLLGSTPVLLGSAPGDISVPDIGQRPIEDVKPSERVTPAGRFVAERGHNLRGEDVVWVDYDAAVSIHRVITTHPSERRVERLSSPSPDDNRISYGCINVAPEFYEAYIRPVFAKQRAVIYVLPEKSSARNLFAPSKTMYAS